MTRELKGDFELLSEFLGQYSLEKSVADKSYLSSIKQMHKVYFSILNWKVEMLSRKDEFEYEGNKVADEVTERLQETISDLGASLFNFAHGGYKSGRIMVRVGIENFIRGIATIESSALATEKNVYKLFEQSAALNIFSTSEVVKKSFQQLHSDYKLLCLDAHTATNTNMAQLSSLGDFPSYDKAKSTIAVDIFVRTTQNILLTLGLLFNAFFHKMHHRNKENVLASIPKSSKPYLHGIK